MPETLRPNVVAALVKRLRGLAHRFVAPPSDGQVGNLEYWRERIFVAVFSIVAVLGALMFLPSAWLAAKAGMWNLVIVDSVAYLAAVTLLVVRPLPSRFRYGMGVMILYLVGVGLLAELGMLGAGLYWLFAFSVVVGVLLGLQAVLVALAINAATVFVAGVLLHAGLFAWAGEGFTIARWTVVSVNFMLLNGLVALSLAVLVYGLEHSLEQQNDVSEANLSLQKQMIDTQKEVIFTLGEVVENRSRETANHVRRVAEISHELAKLAGLPPEEAESLRLASPMHDVGKIAIGDHILLKPGKLTDEERDLMKTHARVGYDILKGSRQPIMQAAAIVALQHHERWDGKGYPAGLAGEGIHRFGRITALADVFDALAAERVYKKAWPIPKVLALIADERGKAFEPRLVDLFLANADRFIAIKEAYPDP